MHTRVNLFANLLVMGTLIVVAPARTPAQGDQVYGRNAKLQMQPYKSPGGRFSMEYPRKDWILLPGAGDVMMSLAQKNGEAVVLIERSQLRTALAPEEITDLFAQLEVDTLKDQDHDAADFQPRVFDAGDRRLIIIQYTQPGLSGRNVVRQYSIPHGQDLFRLICSAPAAQFPKYSAIFAHLAASFQAS